MLRVDTELLSKYQGGMGSIDSYPVLRYTYAFKSAEVAELAYAQVSEACAARLEGSNPSFRTMYHSRKLEIAIARGLPST